ncbi:MAG: dihydropteroate synthase [Bacteroidota bacterium]
MAKTTLNIRGTLADLSNPVVMGIINITPDSFYERSRAKSIEEAVHKAGEMLAEGATFLDLGAFSTRPGANEISEKEEIERLIPVVRELINVYPDAWISVDSFRASVAEKALDAGASIINDISAGSDPHMFDMLAETKAPYIMMHMRGPITKMMANTHYDNLLSDISNYFQQRLQKLAERDIKDVIIDPGFGFSKTLEQNYEILKNLSYFKALESPILVGVSRKSMIYKLLETTPESALLGTSVVNFVALENGARILRVHDVKEAVETIKIFSKIN